MDQDGGRQSLGAGFSCPLASVSEGRQASESRGPHVPSGEVSASLAFAPVTPSGSKPLSPHPPLALAHPPRPTPTLPSTPRHPHPPVTWSNP